VEERTQCCQSRKVRYTERVDYIMQLPVAMEAATNKGKETNWSIDRHSGDSLNHEGMKFSPACGLFI